VQLLSLPPPRGLIRPLCAAHKTYYKKETSLIQKKIKEEQKLKNQKKKPE